MEKDEEKKIWGFIYCFTINDKGYVGQAGSGLKKRFYNHFKDKKRNQYFHRSLRKYFRPGYFRIIEAFYDTKENLKSILNEREIFWISKLDTYDLKQKKGWNLNKGGGGTLGYKHKKSTIKKLKRKRTKIENENNSKAHKGQVPWNKGKSGLQVSWNKGKTYSCPALMGKNNPMYNIGGRHPGARPVILISPEGVEYKLPCYKPFCKEHFLNPTCMRAVFQGKRKHHKGWTGEYVV